jgi:hypothetical protein
MYKVQLHDGRVKEFEDKGNAERYAEVSNGKIVKNTIKKAVKEKLKQFSERS